MYKWFILLYFGVLSLSAQSLLFNEKEIKAFIISDRFEVNGEIRTAGLPVTDRSLFTSEFPGPDKWKWVFTKDSASLTVVVNEQIYTLVFPNNIELITGKDKKERTDALIEGIGVLGWGSFVADEEQHNVLPYAIISDEDIYGILLRYDFYDGLDSTQTFDMGAVVRYLLSGQYTETPEPEIETVRLMIPKYGFERDTLRISINGLSRYFDRDVWMFWIGKEEDSFLLYAKHKLWDYAHMFYHSKSDQFPPVVEFHAYIPEGNVRDIFKQFEKKPNSRGILVE
jgi:hypothetical protein